jgi:signal peptidase II
MIFLIITFVAFGLDMGIKAYVDRKYARLVSHPHLQGKVVVEKFYNKGAALGFFAGCKSLVKAIQTCGMVAVAVAYYFVLRLSGRSLGKVGMALLAGGGLSNLVDRYQKGYVVDYVRFGFGPKWFRRLIFNVSDFFVFIGAVLTALDA